MKAVHWLSENPDIDPWEWLPCFVNYRRDGYDFDALWDDGKASIRQKKMMDLKVMMEYGKNMIREVIQKYYLMI